MGVPIDIVVGAYKESLLAHIEAIDYSNKAKISRTKLRANKSSVFDLNNIIYCKNDEEKLELVNKYIEGKLRYKKASEKLRKKQYEKYTKYYELKHAHKDLEYELRSSI